MNKIIMYHIENGPMIFSQAKNEIKETAKLIITNERRINKRKLYFYTLFDESLTESQKTKIFFMLDQVFYYNKYTLENGEEIYFDKQEGCYLIDDEIISKGDFEDIFRSEVGLRVE